MSDRMSRDQQRLPARLPPRRVFNPTNRFDYDESKRPADVVYEWKLVTVGGMETPEEQILAEQNGWKPVPASRHPEMTGARAQKDGAIIRGGQILMELPKQWYDEAREMDQFTARHTVEEQIQRLGIEGRKNGGPRGGVKRGPMMPVSGEEIG